MQYPRRQKDLVDSTMNSVREGSGETDDMYVCEKKGCAPMMFKKEKRGKGEDTKASLSLCIASKRTPNDVN